MNSWESIWKNRKLNTEKTELDIDDLLALNGYDQPQSLLTPTTILDAVKLYSQKMNTEKGDSIFEVGCGAGAFLHNYYKLGHAKIGGIDLSPELIKSIQKTLPGEFTVMSANELACNGNWDHVVSFSLFMYFPDYEYAKEVLYRMLIKAQKSVTIMDIPDLAKYENCELHRRKLIGPDYDKKYKDLKHLYFHKEWWINILQSLGLSYEIYNQDIPGYENSKFRFNVTIKK